MSQETIRAAERATGQVATMSTYDPDSDQLHEECGVFGVWAPDRDVARLTYFGLRALQHRGQESAGIAVGDGGTVMVRKDLGLLDRVFSNADLSTLSGQLAVGHVRYGTAGAKSWEASQPHLSTINSVIIALAHNGTLVNTDELRRQLIELGVPFLSNSDSEVATKLIGYFTQRTGHLREGIRKTMELVRGGYAMTLINEQALYAFRDPHGIRPLVLGKLVDEGLDQADTASVSQLPSQDGASTVDSAVHVTHAGGWVVASETCALDIVGAEYVRDVRPGEILRISAEGLVSEQGVPAAEESANCIFEQVYFARPDSIMNGKSVYACRYDMGRQLAHEEPVDADLVIGVPDSGLPPAEGYSHESGIPFGEGLIKNRYVGRTFIEPTQELRAMGVRMKLNPLRDNIEGKRLVVIDDSIVRGTTMVQLVKMLRNAGAKEIHIRINSLSAPTRRSTRFASISAPIRWPSFRSRVCLRSCPRAVTAMRALPDAILWRSPRALAATSSWRALSPATWTSHCTLTTTPWSRNMSIAAGKRSTVRPKTCHFGTGLFWQVLSAVLLI